MPIQKTREYMAKLDEVLKVLPQSSAKGIDADKIAEKLKIHRTTAYRYLNSLELMGKVEDERGIWHAKTGEQTIKPLEKEIEIELPIPKNEWQRIALLEAMANDWAENFSETSNVYRIFLDKFKETRTIRIKGKNIDDLDLEKLGNLIQQANEKSSRVSLRGLFKSLKRSHTDSSQRE